MTNGHLKRTSFCVKEIALELYREGKEKDTLTLPYAVAVSKAAGLHDIGKLSIPIEVLSKPSRLSAKESDLVKQHAEKGAQMIEQTLQKGGRPDRLLFLAAEIARSHHERWDGKGYPEGKKDKEIPFSGRITAVADVFDALVSKRSYKKTYSVPAAFAMIANKSGTHFDPEIVSAFLAVKTKIERQYARWGQEPESEH